MRLLLTLPFEYNDTPSFSRQVMQHVVGNGEAEAISRNHRMTMIIIMTIIWYNCAFWNE